MCSMKVFFSNNVLYLMNGCHLFHYYTICKFHAFSKHSIWNELEVSILSWQLHRRWKKERSELCSAYATDFSVRTKCSFPSTLNFRSNSLWVTCFFSFTICQHLFCCSISHCIVSSIIPRILQNILENWLLAQSLHKVLLLALTLCGGSTTGINVRLIDRRRYPWAPAFTFRRKLNQVLQG